MDEPPKGAPEPAGQLAGVATGVLAGLLLSAVWAFGAWDVALALTTVFGGLVLAITLGAPSWRRFGIAMVVAAAAVGAAIVLVVV